VISFGLPYVAARFFDFGALSAGAESCLCVYEGI
jgi:hypothetical protein